MKDLAATRGSKHEWFEWRGMTCCRKCGIIKRTRSPLSGKPLRMKPCKGETKISLREASQALLDACDERLKEPGYFKYVTPWEEVRILHMALDLDEIDPAQGAANPVTQDDKGGFNATD